MLSNLLLALLVAAGGQTTALANEDTFVEADRQDIPAPYRGLWALDPKFCSDPGEATVMIGARQVDFYERHGFLQLAQLNLATDPATFHGQFRWAELLHFSEGGLRLEMRDKKLVITEGDDPDAPRNKMEWTKCPG